MEDKSSVPAHCPGTESESAGKVSACQGCPNKSICSSGAPKKADPGVELVRARLSSVKNKLLVLSGKGGVGKSTFTSLLGRFLAAQNPERNVAILDLDVCGPSMPTMMGVLGEEVHQSGSGWSPVYVDDNLSMMSIGFLLASEDDAVIWRGPKKNGMIMQFLSEVDWGDRLDYLLLDTPPGTSDEHLSASTYLKSSSGLAAIVLTTPQEVSLLDVRKEVDFCRKVKIPVIGIVENMSEFVCPKCDVCSTVFPSDSGGAAVMASQLELPLLGRLPLDPLLTRCCDEGRDFLQEMPNSPTVIALSGIVKKIVEACEREENNFIQS